MRDKTTRTIGATVILIGVAVAGIAQLQGGGDPSAITLVPDTASTDSMSHTTVAVEPFVYRVGVLSGVTTDNFWAFYGADSPSVWNAYILGPTKPALYTLDPATRSPRLELAASEATPTLETDGWQVRVSLTEQLRWSDGEPITAEDFVFTFDTVRRLELGGSWADSFPNIVESAHADSPTELTITFSERPNLATWPHAVGLAPVMPSHIWDPLTNSVDAAGLYELSGSDDVGGGPLRLTEVSPSLIVSTANPGYSHAQAPDRVEYHVFADENGAVAALDEGAIDTVLTPKGLTADHLAPVEDDETVRVTTSPANGVRYLGFNLNREPMSEPAFRSALALLLDRQSMGEQIPTQGDVAKSFISEANQTWFDEDLAAGINERLQGDLATRLGSAVLSLREAGYTWELEPVIADGAVTPGAGLRIGGLAPPPLTILTPGDAYDPSRPRYAAEIAEVLGWLGFDVRPVETDFDSVVDLAFTPGDDGLMHYDMYLLGWTLGSPALPGFYRPLFAADGAMNNTGYESARFAEQLSIYEGTSSFEEAKAALWEMERILAEDLPYLLLYSTSITEAYRADRVSFDTEGGLGGLQGRLGGIGDVRPVAGEAPSTLEG